MFLFTGSNCSSSSEGETTPTALHAGICVRQQSVSIKDAIIAREALSLLVTCLQLRCQQLSKESRLATNTMKSIFDVKLEYLPCWPDFQNNNKLCSYFVLSGSFYNLPSVSDFIIDILLGSPSGEVNNILFLFDISSFQTL